MERSRAASMDMIAGATRVWPVGCSAGCKQYQTTSSNDFLPRRLGSGVEVGLSWLSQKLHRVSIHDYRSTPKEDGVTPTPPLGPKCVFLGGFARLIGESRPVSPFDVREGFSFNPPPKLTKPFIPPFHSLCS